MFHQTLSSGQFLLDSAVYCFRLKTNRLVVVVYVIPVVLSVIQRVKVSLYVISDAKGIL